MTAALWLRDIGAYAVQVALLVIAGGCLARLFRLRDPRAMLAYWRTLLAACLLLPICQPWTLVTPAFEVPVVQTGGALPGARNAAAPHDSDRAPGLDIESSVLAAVAAGIAARATWLFIGACALGRLRRRATRLDPLPESIRRAQERVGTSAAICVSARISGPITFGLIRPVVVFPPGVSAMAPHVQEAIACHELLHVRRRDWIVEILEEGVRTLLWFHPAIWWLIDRIQLSREQVVDAETIRLTESRDRYVEALLVVAVAKSSGVLTPASAFLRKSLLKKRVALILQESTMTTRRLFLSLAASAGALAVAAALAIQSFPLQAQGPQNATGAPVQIVKGGEHLLHGDLPEYPRRAIEQKVEGDVVLDLFVDDRGEVSDARVLSGPDELRRAALEAVLRWHYANTDVRSQAWQAVLRFHVPARDARAEINQKEFTVTTDTGEAFTVKAPGSETEPLLVRAQRLERLMNEVKRGLDTPGISAAERAELTLKSKEAQEKLAEIREERAHAGLPLDGQARVTQIRMERVTEAVARGVFARAGVSVGDRLSEEAINRVQKAAAAIDEHLRVELAGDGKGGVILTLINR